MFEALEARALSPAAVGVGPAESGDHDIVDQAPADDAVRCEVRKEQTRGMMVGAIGRVEEVGHLGISCVAAPSAASRSRSPSPLPAPSA